MTGMNSKTEKVILAVVLALVVLVVISWAADGFACNETGKYKGTHNNPSQIFGNGASATTNVNHSEDVHTKT